MSDLFEFEKNLIEIEEEFKSRLGEDYIFHRSFVQIRDMVETMILERDEKIKDLESKLKFSNATPPPSVEKPKTIEEYYDLIERKRKLLFSYWQNNKTSQSEKCFDEFEKFYKKMKNDYGQDVNIIALKKNKRLSDEVKMEICHEVNLKYSNMIKKYNISQKICPSEKIINPKTGRCIKKKEKKTSKKECPPGKIINPKTGRCIKKKEKKTSKKECPPGKIINPKTGRCIKKPKEKGISMDSQEYGWMGEDSEVDKDLDFEGALERARNGPPGTYRKLLNKIKKIYGVKLQYNDMGDLYFYKNGEEAEISLMNEVKQYVFNLYPKK